MNLVSRDLKKKKKRKKPKKKPFKRVSDGARKGQQLCKLCNLIQIRKRRRKGEKKMRIKQECNLLKQKVTFGRRSGIVRRKSPDLN